MRALLLAFLLGSCWKPPEPFQQESFPDLTQDLDHLSVRLLWAAERVRFWEDLHLRRQEAAEIACRLPNDPEWPRWAIARP